MDEEEGLGDFFEAAISTCEENTTRIYTQDEAEELLRSEGVTPFWEGSVMKEADVDILYTLAQDIVAASKSHQVEIWIDGGTLLGAIRHGGLIPWDDDIDFAMLYSQDHPFRESVQPCLEAAGYKVLPWWFGGYRVCRSDPSLPHLDESGCTFPFADIFHLRGSQDLLSYRDGQAKALWPSGLRLDYLRPIQLLPFGPLLLPAPRDPSHHLHSLYGDSWPRVAYQQYNHASREWKRKIKVQLDRFIPVLPSPNFKVPLLK